MSRVVYLAILCVGLGMFMLVQWKYRADLGAAREHYRVESHLHTVEVAQKLENTFTQMYQGLRTMARLPGVQTIDRHANHFDKDAKTTVVESGALQSREAGAALQQILAATHSVSSEVAGGAASADEMSASVINVLASVATVRSVGADNARVVAQMQSICEEVVSSAQAVAATVQEQSTGIAEVGRVAEDLSDMAGRLQEMVKDFQVDRAPATELLRAA